MNRFPTSKFQATIVPSVLITLFFLFCGLFSAVAFSKEPNSPEAVIANIAAADLKRHCGTLASDAMEGREAGSQGGRAASAYLLTELRKISGLVPAGADGWVQEFGSNFRNVVAMLPGSDPELRHEIVVIGAHYDHVGRGNRTNSLGPFGYIHNGADDNASGTAALLELARGFAALEPAPRRSVMFAFWDAEEMGLVGSKHWVAHPTRPLKDLRFVMNIDMLGRLREGRLTVAGWRSAAGLRSRLTALNPDNDLEFLFEPRVIAESDHYSFYAVGIPAMHIDTGKHEDYHRPTDDADKLNYAGIQRLTRLAFQLTYDCAMQPELPPFRREALTESPPVWMAPQKPMTPTPRLGVSFDTKEFERDRLVISQVSPGSAASRAGIRPGDRLMKFANWEQGTTAELLTIVQIAKNPVVVRLVRPNFDTPIETKLELTGEPVRVGIRWQSDNAMPGQLAITRVIHDSPADRAGISVGDIVLRIGGDPISDEQQFRQRLLGDPSPIELVVERNGRVSNVAVDLFDRVTVPSGK